MSPIAHPELAGNGIENTRGAFQRCTTGERTNKTDLRRVSTPSSNAFLCVVEYRVVRTAGTIVSMERTKRIGSLDERETTLEYIEESSVASIIDIERIRKKKKSHRGALDQATSFLSCEVEETSHQFDEAEAAIERFLEA